ncbi:hypothetical protein TNCV_4233401 [Trichonephila clavipes]|nr:hypothetical protein TNCV_4233401 [Trichonephila clavipes]
MDITPRKRSKIIPLIEHTYMIVRDIAMLQETKLPVRLINTTHERRRGQGYETPLRVKGDIEDVSSELNNGS